MTQTVAARRPQEADRRRRGSRSEEAEDRRRGSRSSASEELAWGCAGIALALGGSGLACVTGRAHGHRRAESTSSASCSRAPTTRATSRSPRWRCPSPATGSDISGLKTTAQQDGDHWIIRGSKQWITNGQSASVYVVWAQTDPSRGSRRRARLHRRARHARPRARQEGDEARHPRVGDRAGPLRGRAASTRT